MNDVKELGKLKVETTKPDCGSWRKKHCSGVYCNVF